MFHFLYLEWLRWWKALQSIAWAPPATPKLITAANVIEVPDIVSYDDYEPDVPIESFGLPETVASVQGGIIFDQTAPDEKSLTFYLPVIVLAVFMVLVFIVLILEIFISSKIEPVTVFIQETVADVHIGLNDRTIQDFDCTTSDESDIKEERNCPAPDSWKRSGYDNEGAHVTGIHDLDLADILQESPEKPKAAAKGEDSNDNSEKPPWRGEYYQIQKVFDVDNIRGASYYEGAELYEEMEYSYHSKTSEQNISVDFGSVEPTFEYNGRDVEDVEHLTSDTEAENQNDTSNFQGVTALKEGSPRPQTWTLPTIEELTDEEREERKMFPEISLTQSSDHCTIESASISERFSVLKDHILKMNPTLHDAQLSLFRETGELDLSKPPKDEPTLAFGHPLDTERDDDFVEPTTPKTDPECSLDPSLDVLPVFGLVDTDVNASPLIDDALSKVSDEILLVCVESANDSANIPAEFNPGCSSSTPPHVTSTPERLPRKESILRVVFNEEKSPSSTLRCSSQLSNCLANPPESPSKIPRLTRTRETAAISTPVGPKIDAIVFRHFLTAKAPIFEDYLNEVYGEDPDDIVFSYSVLSQLDFGDLRSLLDPFDGKESSQNWKQRFDNLDPLIGLTRLHLPLEAYEEFQEMIKSKFDIIVEVARSNRSMLLVKFIVFIRDFILFASPGTVSDELFVMLLDTLIPLTRATQPVRYVRNMSLKALCTMIQSVSHRVFIQNFDKMFKDTFHSKKNKNYDKHACLVMIKFFILTCLHKSDSSIVIWKVVNLLLPYVNKLAIDALPEVRAEILCIYMLILQHTDCAKDVVQSYYENLSPYMRSTAPKIKMEGSLSNPLVKEKETTLTQ